MALHISITVRTIFCLLFLVSTPPEPAAHGSYDQYWPDWHLHQLNNKRLKHVRVTTKYVTFLLRWNTLCNNVKQLQHQVINSLQSSPRWWVSAHRWWLPGARADHVTLASDWSDQDILPPHWSVGAASNTPSSAGSSEIIIEQRLSNKVSNQRLKYWSGPWLESRSSSFIRLACDGWFL